MMERNNIVHGLICDIRKFSVYRTASKLISLKQNLKTEYIPYKLVLSVLDIYRLNSPVIDRQEISEEKLDSIVHDTFFAADKQGYFSNLPNIQSIDILTRDVTQYLLGIFNSNKASHNNTEKIIRLHDLKQALLILCKVSNQEDLIYEHFLLNCDHNRCVTRFRLKEMISNIAQILLHVDREFDMDDWHRSNVIDEWFAKCPGIVGLSQYHFTSFWVESKSIFQNYAQLMAICQRIMDTKDVVHPSECFICKTAIKGLRFECTICSNYSLCFQCFAVGITTEHHALSHRLGNAHFFNKCRLLFKKCWAVLYCRDSSRRMHSIGMTTIRTNFDEFRHEFATITNQSVSNQETILSRRNSNQFECKLSSIIGLIAAENEKLHSHISELEKHGKSNTDPTKKLIKSHLEALKIIICQLEEYSMRATLSPTSSTPYRNPSIIRKNTSQTDVFLSKSLKGAEINKSFLDQNNSNLSISDVSSWLHMKRLSSVTRDKKENLPTVSEDTSIIDTDMQNFKELLHIVKDIIEDTYSDNTELSKATNQLENALHNIIEGEERKRKQSDQM